MYFTAPFSCLDGLPQHGNSHLLTEEAANARGATTHNERRIPGRGPLGPLGPVLTTVCALLTGCALLAGCTASPGQPAFKLAGPPSGWTGKYPAASRSVRPRTPSCPSAPGTRRPAVVQGPGLPERRFRPGLQQPPVLGRSGYRHRLRVVRAAVPDGAAPVRLLAVPPISE